jgi:hypothetical protein
MLIYTLFCPSFTERERKNFSLVSTRYACIWRENSEYLPSDCLHIRKYLTSLTHLSARVSTPIKSLDDNDLMLFDVLRRPTLFFLLNSIYFPVIFCKDKYISFICKSFGSFFLKTKFFLGEKRAEALCRRPKIHTYLHGFRQGVDGETARRRHISDLIAYR